ALSGRKLAKPYVFRFTTPTVRLRGTDSYRRGDVAGGRTVVLLRFNQPVRAADIAPVVERRTQHVGHSTQHVGHSTQHVGHGT
ncbi:MAG TPA: hypothetical protein VNJ04_04130, partial [Gemmatimonadaceae bacterium]|nr:hypothetical protein [Gemmatimonadaceae bacterium]